MIMVKVMAATTVTQVTTVTEMAVAYDIDSGSSNGGHSDGQTEQIVFVSI